MRFPDPCTAREIWEGLGFVRAGERSSTLFFVQQVACRPFRWAQRHRTLGAAGQRPALRSRAHWHICRVAVVRTKYDRGAGGHSAGNLIYLAVNFRALTFLACDARLMPCPGRAPSQYSCTPPLRVPRRHFSGSEAGLLWGVRGCLPCTLCNHSTAIMHAERRSQAAVGALRIKIAHSNSHASAMA